MLDTATIYQIFYRHHCGDSKQEIAARLHVARLSTIRHLSGMYFDEYPDDLFRRIRPFIKKPKYILPDGKWIPLQFASYFFPDRPTVRALSRSYPLRITVVNGLYFTTRNWILNALHDQNLPSGLLLTRSACRHLKIQPSSDIVPALDIGLPTVDWEIVHHVVEIQNWTGMPFITLNRSDLV